MTQLIYSGIGSRDTPTEVLDNMKVVAAELATRGWMLRSGHAFGADQAFETGALAVQGDAEIYLPWNGFNNGHHLLNSCINAQALPNWNAAAKMATAFHPAWDKCTRGAQALHTRNIYQILGLDLRTPVNCVICWTRDGKASGGTGQALRLAEYLEIPVFNLQNEDALTQLADFVYNLELAAAKEKVAQ